MRHSDPARKHLASLGSISLAWQAGYRWVNYHPRTTFMAEFVGAANLEPVKIVGGHPPKATVVWHDYRLELPAPEGGAANEALLCIRPEAITISADPGANPRTFDGAVYLLCDPHRVHLIAMPTAGPGAPAA